MAYSQKIALKAIIARLNAVSAVTSVVSTRIYSDIIENPTFPYILVELSSTPFDTKDSSDQEHQIFVHCFSKKNTPTEAMDILSGIYSALNRTESNITLDSGYLTYSQFAGVNDIFKEPDGITWHGVMNFNFLITA
jgi:hypothetical protein